MKDERTYKIIGAGIEVHKELGCGFLEAVYQEALEREFGYQEISFKSQPIIQIAYKGKPLDKSYQPDFVCYKEVIVEIKAISSLSGNVKVVCAQPTYIKNSDPQITQGGTLARRDAGAFVTLYR